MSTKPQTRPEPRPLGPERTLPERWQWQVTYGFNTRAELHLVDGNGNAYLSLPATHVNGRATFDLVQGSLRLLAAAKAIQDLGWARGHGAQDGEMETALKLIDAAISEAEGTATEGTESTERRNP